MSLCNNEPLQEAALSLLHIHEWRPADVGICVGLKCGCVWGCICTGASQLPTGSMERAKHERGTEREGARDTECLYEATAHASHEQDYTTLWLPHLSVCKWTEQWVSDSSQTSSAREEYIMGKMWMRGHGFKCDRVQLLWMLSSISLSSILLSGPI